MSIAVNISDEASLENESRSEPKQDLYTRISSIERDHPAPRDRAKEFLCAVVESLGCLAGALTLGVCGEEFDLRQMGDNEGLAAWVGTLDTIALEVRSHAKTTARLFGKDASAPEYAVIACPIDLAGRDPFGGVAVLVKCGDVPEAERLQLHLRSVCLHAAGLLSKPAAKRSAAIEMDDIARVYNRAGQFSSLHEFAYAITNAARQRFNCDQASMGRYQGGKIKLLCVSGLDTIKKRSPGVHRIEQAMGECADLARPIVGQPRDTWDETMFAEEGKLHLRWRTSVNNACVLSVPILAEEEVVGVLSFRRSADQPFDGDDLDALNKLLAPLAGAVPLVARSTLGLHRHTVLSAKESAGWMFARGSNRKRIAVLVAAAGLTWFMAVPSSYHINTSAVVIADHERIISAPSDGMIAEVVAGSGDFVEKGRVLFRMDTTDLVAEERGLRAEIDATTVRLNNAIADDNPGGAAIAHSERVAQKIRLAQARRGIEESVIRAPVTGVVIGPALSDAQGTRVSKGQPVLSIAEDGALSLELSVPEGRVASIEPGSRVRFASHARPESPGMTDLARVAPAAVQRKGKQVFIAEAGLPSELDWLRPGMEGVAIIDAGKRPNWWLATHRILDAARLRFWID